MEFCRYFQEEEFCELQGIRRRPMYRAFVLDCAAPNALLRDSGDGTTHPAMCGVARSCGTDSDSDPSHPHAFIVPVTLSRDAVTTLEPIILEVTGTF